MGHLSFPLGFLCLFLYGASERSTTKRTAIVDTVNCITSVSMSIQFPTLLIQTSYPLERHVQTSFSRSPSLIKPSGTTVIRGSSIIVGGVGFVSTNCDLVWARPMRLVIRGKQYILCSVWYQVAMWVNTADHTTYQLVSRFYLFIDIFYGHFTFGSITFVNMVTDSAI